jgi:hypothetical protein
MADTGQDEPSGGKASSEPGKPSEQQWFRANPEEPATGEQAGIAAAPRRPASGFNMLVIGIVVLGVIGVIFYAINRSKPKTNSDDWGQGVFDAAGLRGHLVTRWVGKAQYQVQITPIDARENEGFAMVTEHPPTPISFNIRLLDSSGFALCGKEILLPYNPDGATAPSMPAPRSKAEAARQAQIMAAWQAQNAKELQRENGQDVFQNHIGPDGKVDAINAQGVLPCSPQQYKHVDYWDFSTNFPTIDEQQNLLEHPPRTALQMSAEARMAAKRKAARRSQSAFYMEGDERVTGFDTTRGILVGGPGNNFTITRKSDLATAEAWAANSSLIHYKCDQHANCALKRADSPAPILAKLNE